MHQADRQTIEAHILWLGNKGQARVVQDGVNNLLIYDEIHDVYARTPLRDRAMAMAAVMNFVSEHQRLFVAWLEKTHGSK